MDGEKLHKKYCEESEKHEKILEKYRKRKQEENQRHRDKKFEIRRESGLDEVEEIRDEIEEKINDIKNTTGELKQIVYRSLYGFMGRKRTCINKSITIREKKVYKYRCQTEASMRNIIENRKGVYDKINDEEDVEKAQKIMDRIRSFKEWKKYGYTSFSMKTRKDIPKEKQEKSSELDDYTEIIFKASEYPTLRIRITSEDMDDEISFKEMNFSSYTGFAKNPKVALLLSDEFVEGAKEIKKEIEEELQRRQKILDEVQDIACEYLVMQEL